MLTWDEEVTPTSPTPNLSDSMSHQEFPPSSLTAPSIRTLNDGAVVPSSVAPIAPVEMTKPVLSGKRINAADKRIINGQTDVNQLVPFKYKWAWDCLLYTSPSPRD